MKTMTRQNSLSSGDFKRLQESFFSSADSTEESKKLSNKKLIFLLIGFVTLCAAIVVFFRFDTFILSPYTHALKNGALDLLSESALAEAELIWPEGVSEIAEGEIRLAIPSGGKDGFSLTFADKMNLSGAKFALIVKNPETAFTIDLILRDSTFFSNAQDPLQIQVERFSKNKSFVEIPIEIDDSLAQSLNLWKINQLRFVFHQQEKKEFPVLVKNILFEKRR